MPFSVSLLHRGNGTGSDADAGWEKMWRAAVWAQLGNKVKFYEELTVGEKADAESLADSPFSMAFIAILGPIYSVCMALSSRTPSFR